MIHERSIAYSSLLAAALFLYGAGAQGQTLRLSLQEVVSLAAKHNRTLKASGIDIAVAQEQRRVARSLSLPSASLGAQYAHYFELPVFFGIGETNGDPDKVAYSRFGGRDQFSAALSVAQPLYNPSAKPAQREAALQEKASRTLYLDKTVDLTAAVKRTYLGILVLNKRLQLQHESLQRNEKALQDARSLLAQGRALRVDTLRAYTSVKNLQPDILKLTKAIEVGKLQLTTLMGLDSLQDIMLTDSLAHPAAASIPAAATVYTEARANRPDLQQLRLQQEIREQGIALAKARRLPVVSLVGQYQLQSQARSFRFFDASWPGASFAGAQVTLPLFSGSSNKARIQQARLTHEQAGIELTDAYEQLRTEVRQVIANLQETFERVQTQTQVKETAKLSYDIIQYRYQKGVASRLELTDAELALTTAQLNYLEAVYDYLAAGIELDRTRGKQ
ncbi:TolC family protein [Chitinophaga japonensis]|uniref:Outer membrane protein TolC n=1 Tax=Chitinophaga japonensis TaxID=104662 RepID=A0A562T8B8_CHIJA|nr:TolC family protein [Chitinophaga japonensis]TWI89100.1 outer membrane protein TolC [Chitinophaga japonensis]